MIIYGKQLFFHILKNYPNKVQEVYLSKKCDQKTFNSIVKVCQNILRVDNKKAQALSHGGNHQGFIAKIDDFEFYDFSELKKSNFLIILDSVTDVGNIGAIIRSAYAFGADGLIISGIKSINFEAIVRTSSSAAFELPIVLYPSSLDMLNELKQVGFVLYGAHMNGEDINSVHFADKKAIIMGSVGEGIQKKVLEKLDKKISIKMARVFDSLNVSAAAAIICNRIANG